MHIMQTFIIQSTDEAEEKRGGGGATEGEIEILVGYYDLT